jgi:hypothetical protein
MTVREQHLDELNNFMMPQESRDYRFRLTFVQQVEQLCTLYSIESVNGMFSAIALTLAIGMH